jgi:hypothetical protein
MLVQYLVGLCCLQWDREAIDVTIGDMVLDTAADKERDVDITVTVVQSGELTHAFKAYEVKKESTPLDVSEVEQLCAKFSDMPTVTHRAIVSASGFTAAAQKKAEHHEVNLYVIRPWTRPLQDQFPALEMHGTAEECFPMSKLLLCWVQPQYSIVAREAKGGFTVQHDSILFDKDGKVHRYKTFGEYQKELLLRSTEVLYPLEPAITIFRTFPVPFSAPDGITPAGPAWPHTHTIEVANDAVYIDTGAGVYKIDLITITGHLQWQRSGDAPLYYVIEQIPTGDAFAGALISTEARDGHMTALVFSPKTREIDIHFVRLAEKHLNCIRRLKLDFPDRTRES